MGHGSVLPGKRTREPEVGGGANAAWGSAAQMQTGLQPTPLDVDAVIGEVVEALAQPPVMVPLEAPSVTTSVTEGPQLPMATDGDQFSETVADWNPETLDGIDWSFLENMKPC